MTKSRCLYQVVAFLAIAVLFACAQQASAQEGRSHLQVRAFPVEHPAVKANAIKFDELYQLAYGFGALPPKDENGYDEWPCEPNPADPNYADCSSIAGGGAVIGMPAYTASYAACDADSATSTNCGQIFWFYEDDTGDSIDDLIVSIVAKQGTNFVLDTGKINLGPNPYAGSVVVMSSDVAFGTLGESGKSNGYCGFVEESKKTCSDPFAGIVTITVTTTVGPSKIMKAFDINLE